MNTAEILSIIDAEIGKLQHVRALLTGYSDPTAPVAKRGPGRPKKSETAAKTTVKKAVKRVMSEEARSKIAAAQKKRWAASKKAAK